jgi:hypothetical protein
VIPLVSPTVINQFLQQAETQDDTTFIRTWHPWIRQQVASEPGEVGRHCRLLSVGRDRMRFLTPRDEACGETARIDAAMRSREFKDHSFMTAQCQHAMHGFVRAVESG